MPATAYGPTETATDTQFVVPATLVPRFTPTGDLPQEMSQVSVTRLPPSEIPPALQVTKIETRGRVVKVIVNADEHVLVGVNSGDASLGEGNLEWYSFSTELEEPQLVGGAVTIDPTLWEHLGHSQPYRIGPRSDGSRIFVTK